MAESMTGLKRSSRCALVSENDIGKEGEAAHRVVYAARLADDREHHVAEAQQRQHVQHDKQRTVGTKTLHIGILRMFIG